MQGVEDIFLRAGSGAPLKGLNALSFCEFRVIVAGFSSSHTRLDAGVGDFSIRP